MKICHVAPELLPVPPTRGGAIERWIRESIATAGFRVIDLGTDTAIDAALVPAGALADPVDRCLVATAREHQLPLVTRDRRILDYASRTRLVKVVDASV